jgi:hypothetical protein
MPIVGADSDGCVVAGRAMVVAVIWVFLSLELEVIGYTV